MPLEKAPGGKCDECPLVTCPIVPTYWPEGATTLLVGEAPGSEEARVGKPFVGASGQLLERLLISIDVDPATVARTNVVLCYVGGNPEPDPSAVAACSGRLLRDRNRAARVVALGNYAAAALTIPDRGVWHGYNISTWHPAYVLRNPNAVTELRDHLYKAFHMKPQASLQPDVKVADTDMTEFVWALMYLKERGGDLVLDLETDQIDWAKHRILCMGLTNNGQDALVITDTMLYDEEANASLRAFFEGYKGRIGGHNFLFDRTFIAHQLGIRLAPGFDTMLAHHCIKETAGGHGLKELASFWLDAPDYETELIAVHLNSRNDWYSRVPRPDLYAYNARDVCYNWRLIPIIENQLEGHLKALYEVFLNVVPAVSEMELKGMQVDLVHLGKVQAWLIDECGKHTESLRTQALEVIARVQQTFDNSKVLARIRKDGFNPASTQQVALVLFDGLHLRTNTAPRKKPRSTDKEVLGNLKGTPFVDELRLFRKKSKLLNTYVMNLIEGADERGRVHADFKLPGTEVMRMASFFHTMPRPGDPLDELSYMGRWIRQGIIAAPGCRLVICDYSQAELRVAAALSGEPFLLDAYAKDEDIHGNFARDQYGPNWNKEQRALCKMVVFSFLYGGSEYSMANEEGMDMALARELVKGLKRTMPRLTAYRDEAFALMKSQGYVETRLGFRRRFPLITDDNREEARKSAMHVPIAGTVAGFKLVALSEALSLGLHPVLEVHDSIIIEETEGIAELAGGMLAATMAKYATQYVPEVPWKVDMKVVDRWVALDDAS